MKFAYLSDIGKMRTKNQDTCCVLSNDGNQILGIVCDGMGGHLAGELASNMAVNTICQDFLGVGIFSDAFHAKKWINQKIKDANLEIFQDAKANKQHLGMGTTIVGFIIVNNEICIFNIGDSRAYFCDQTIVQLTKDDTYVNMLVESGTINKEQARFHPQKNVLLKALGVFNDISAVSDILPLKEGYYLLCSDGLYNCVKEEEMLEIVNSTMTLEEKVMELVDMANNHGGTDNISVVLLDSKAGGVSYD